MIGLNDAAIEYMKLLGFRDIVLLTDDGKKTWCDPSFKREVSVDFTDEDLSADDSGYIVESSPVGLVYIPAHTVDVEENACIRYERHPWIECFELDGIKPAEVCCLWQPGAGAAADEQ